MWAWIIVVIVLAAITGLIVFFLNKQNQEAQDELPLEPGAEPGNEEGMVWRERLTKWGGWLKKAFKWADGVPQNGAAKTLIVIITALIGVVAFTWALNMITGYNVAKSPLYYIAILLVVILVLIDWTRGTGHLNVFYNTTATVFVVVVLLLLVRAIHKTVYNHDRAKPVVEQPAWVKKGGAERASVKTITNICIADADKENTEALPAMTNLKVGEKLSVHLSPGEASRWFFAPTGVTYDINSVHNGRYRVYYRNHAPVDIGDKNIGLPDVSPAIFKVINTGGAAEDFDISGL